MCQCTCQPGIIDTRDIEHEGRTLTVTVYEDWDSRPHDADCYSADDIAAWERNAWGYVGVVVTEGATEIGGLWGVVYGAFGDHAIGMDSIITVHPVPDMIGGR